MAKKKQENIHPIASVQWVDPKTLHANNYNPNHVFGPELQLLKTSLLEDGWTQPIVVRESGEIVDGFHRWTLATTDQQVAKVSNNLVPVVVLRNKSEAQLMASTVRHNRARGQHGILKMASITQALRESGLDDKQIQRFLGMDREELKRMLDTTPGPQSMGKESYGKGWVTTQ